MNEKLKQLKNVVSEVCITIILNTHRTKPDNQKDPILLKNLVKEAENRLLEDYEKRFALPYIEKLNKIADSIEHHKNIESLIIFVNEDIAEFIRLPIKVIDRVVIDNTFATRDLIRSIHSETNYYVLLLSRDNVRLIEASSDKVVEELGEPFPLVNNDFQPESTAESANAGRVRNLNSAFFNEVDKAVNLKIKENPLPILVATDEANYHEYIKTADNKDIYLEEILSGNRLHEKDHAVVKDAWKIVQEITVKKNNKRKEELLRAVGENKFLSDTNEIWRAITEGRVQTVFVEQGLFQPAILENNHITYVSDEQREEKEVIDDIYDEIIEANLKYGGDVVFLPKGELDKFNGFGAITRY